MTVDPQARPWAAIDGPSLAQAAAALQLLPDNRPALLRLQSLAAIGASLPVREERARLSPSALRHALQQPVVEQLMRHEDPPEDLFVCEIPYHGGPHLAIEGLSTGSGYTVGLLLRALFSPHQNQLPEEYRNEAALLTTALLRISNLVCRRAGLQRGQEPSTKIRTKIFVPGRERLEELTQVVLITHDDLSRLLPAAAVPMVYNLALSPGSKELSATQDDGQLVAKPFLKVAAGILVISPAELSASLRHHLVTLACRYECEAKLASAFRLVVAQHAAWVLLLFGMRLQTPVETTADPLVLRQRFEFAGDKLLDMAIITDDLRDYNVDNPYDNWNVLSLGPRVQDIIDPEGDASAEDTRTLRLILHQPLGRGYFLGLMDSRRPGPVLMITLNELETIAVLDGDDPLVLWRFAEATTRLEESIRVISFSTLDNFGLYRGNEYSYYISDDRPPNLLTVSTDHSLPLKAEANRKADPHEVLSPHKPAFIQVVSVHGKDKAPIYVVHPRHTEDETMVELEDLTVWVGSGANPSHDLKGFVNEIASAAAYWIWQLSLEIPELLQASASDGRLYVELAPDDSEAWTVALSRGPGETGETAWICPGDSKIGHARLLLAASGAGSLFSDSNSADRLLVSALSAALSDASGIVLRDQSALIDRVSPVGKKKIIRVTTANQVLLRPPFFRRPRFVQPATMAVVLDELGEWLAADGLEEGPVPDAERNDLLQKCVEHYFKRIEATVRELTPDGLIEFLIRRDEALVHADALERESLAFRIACFGESPDLTREIAESEHKRTETAIASRFLIEYVAAKPPTGDRQISLDIYDQLLATAAEIYGRATLSDAIHYEFSEAKLSLLKSGRLGTSRGDRYESGTSAFGTAQAEAVRLIARGPETVTGRGQAGAAPLSPAVESGMLAEFGFTLVDLREGIGALIHFGDEYCPGEPCRSPRIEVERELIASLGWPADKAQQFINALSLSPRDDFLSVGPEAWPWRYNREWSYARRPLIRTVGADARDDLVWGVRRLWSTPGYWASLVHSGRMRAKSPELKRIIGTIRQAENKAFEQAVADALGRGGCTITAKGLAKVGGRKLRSAAGDDLGDIDALGIHLQRRLIFVCEAKDFEMARIPREFANEANSLLYGERSAVRKLTGRANWVRQNLPAMLKHFQLDVSRADFTVVPIVVTSRSLVTPQFLSCPLPIIAIEGVEEFVQRTVSGAKLAPAGRRTARRVGR